MTMLKIYKGKQDFFVEQRGLYLAVHNNTQIPLTLYEGIKIPVGYASDISIKRTFNNRLAEPHSSCRKDTDSYYSTDSDYYKTTLAYTKYSKKLCFEICLQNLLIIPACNCSDPSVPITDKNQTICSTLTNLDCVDKIRNQLDSTDLSGYCDKYCPTECDKVSYDTKIFLSDYPTTYYYDIVSKQTNLVQKFSSFGNVTYSSFKESVLMVNIFYQELVYTEISEQASYTFIEMVGVIGKLFLFALMEDDDFENYFFDFCFVKVDN